MAKAWTNGRRPCPVGGRKEAHASAKAEGGDPCRWLAAPVRRWAPKASAWISVPCRCHQPRSCASDLQVSARCQVALSVTCTTETILSPSTRQKWANRAFTGLPVDTAVPT